jgi:hypothetical protein
MRVAGRIKIIFKTVHDGEKLGSYIRQCMTGKNQDHIYDSDGEESGSYI